MDLDGSYRVDLVYQLESVSIDWRVEGPRETEGFRERRLR